MKNRIMLIAVAKDSGLVINFQKSEVLEVGPTMRSSGKLEVNPGTGTASLKKLNKFVYVGVRLPQM